MTTHPFLSEAWIEAARAIHDEHRASLPPPDGPPVRMNLVVEDVPFEPGRLEAHLDTTSGLVEVDLGHLADAAVVVTLGYPTAQAILVDGDRQAAMQAFMSGEIRVEGDLAVLLNAFSGQAATDPGPIGEALRAITAPLSEG